VNKKIIPNLAIKIKQNKLKIDFRGGDISSDSGLIIVKQLDEKIGFMDNINKLIEDPRDPKKITHTQQQLLTQRIYQIIAGYEDCADANRLKNDPIFKIIAGKNNLKETLGSQPTLSRLENRISRFQITQLKRQLLEQHLKSVSYQKDQPIILDCDSTEDPVHGEQQLTFFNKHFDTYCYHPLLVFEANSQTLLTAHLRAGNQNPSRNATRILLPVIHRIKQKHSEHQIILRGDAAFGSKRMMDFCSTQGCDYLFSVGNTKGRFNKHIESFIQKAQLKYEKANKEITMYFQFRYSSRIWKKPVKIRGQIKLSCAGLMMRFLATNLKGSIKELFAFYNQRAQCENYIKELKCQFKADRLSCQKFKANFFRLLLHCFAYQLIILFKHLLSRITRLGQIQIDTLRYRFLKIGAVVYQRARWIWIQFSSSWPFRKSFLKMMVQLGAG
jgi:hypothetical protein